MSNRPILCAQRNYQARAEAITYIADFTPLLQSDETITQITGQDTHTQDLGIGTPAGGLIASDAAILAADTIVDAQNGLSGIEVLAEKAVTFLLLAAAVAPEAAEGDGTEFEIKVTVLTSAGNTRQIVCALVVQD